MDFVKDWDKVKRHFSMSFRTNLHVSIASVDSDHIPTVTPIGSLFINDDQAGFYFEKYTRKLPSNARGNNNVCILGVNSGRFFWLKALYRGYFDGYPALKLYGQLGDLRQATDQEISRLERRMRRTKGLRGHRYLWGEMQMVRDIRFLRVEKIDLRKMTETL